MSLMGLNARTTGAKAAVFDEQGHTLAGGYRQCPMLHPRPAWMELDPEQVWQSSVNYRLDGRAGAVP